MPTPSPEPARPAESHRQRDMAESFGADAERYDRTRPSYPGAMVDAIIAASPGPVVLDVGCGTGIAARQFHAAGCSVLGVEPDARMAEFASRGGLEVEVATFEAWDHAGRTFDTVIAGQTWHWVDPVAGTAKAAQVLRPGGRLALFWNVFQPPPDVAEAFSEVHRRVTPGPLAGIWTRPVLDGYGPMFGKVADGIQEADAFSDPEQWRFDWERSYTRDEWLDQVPTSGVAGRLPQSTMEELLAGTGAAIDALGGSFTMHYATIVVTTTRTS